MKTEDFDDAIKRKLESINPVFNEQDIERVHQYTIRNRGPLSILRSGRFLWSVIGAGMLVTGLLTWKFTSLYDRNAHIVQQAVVQPANQDVRKQAAPKIITKTDTVYLTKYVNKYPMSYSAKKQQKQVVLASNITKSNSDPGSKNNYRTAGSYLTPHDDILKSNSANNTTNGGLTPALSNSNTQNTSSKNNINDATSGNQKNNDAALNSPEPKPAETPADKNDPSAASAKKAPIHNYSEEHKKTKAANRNLNLTVMAGAGGEIANTQMGGGVYAKIMTQDRISFNRVSLNLGVKLLSVNYMKYDNDWEYEQATGYDFKWAYARDLSPNCEISNISFTHALWQIPLSVEYDLRLKNDWFISGSIGTDLDIACIGGLEFTSTEGYGSDITQQPHDQTINYSTVLFNNAVGSLGFIKQWRQVSVQLSGFTSQQLVSAVYKGSNSRFYGCDMKLFYSF